MKADLHVGGLLQHADEVPGWADSTYRRGHEERVEAQLDSIAGATVETLDKERIKGS
jgi:hypothetical protein